MSNCQKNFFDGWESLKFPQSTHDLWDYLCENYPDDWYLIDYLPVKMEDPETYFQCEVTYAHAEQSSAGREEYHRLEGRFLRVLSLLWGVYDNRCETEVDAELLNRGLECISHQDISHDGASMQLRSIENLTAYKRLAQLSLREKTVHTIFFSGAELIVWVDGLCLTAFTRNTDTVSLLERISTTEGLYLRKKEWEW